MSLTFRNVRQISRRQGSSLSITNKRYKTRDFQCSEGFDEEILDDFPPLKNPTCEYTFEDLPRSRFSNREFLEQNYNKCFEEVRWNDYQHKFCSGGKSYSQCLTKNNFETKLNISYNISNKQITTPCPHFTTQYVSHYSRCYLPETSPIYSQANSNFKTVNSPHIPLLKSSSTKSLQLHQSIAHSPKPLTDFTSNKPSTEKKVTFQLSSTKSNLQKQTSSVNILEIKRPQEIKRNVVAQRSQLNLSSNFNINSRLTRTKSIGNISLNSSPKMTPTLINSCSNLSNPDLKTKSYREQIHSQLLAKISEESSSISLKPKERSIHTMNDAQVNLPTSGKTSNLNTVDSKPIEKLHFERLTQQIPQKHLEPSHAQKSLFPNTTWFLQENISNQFGFNQTLTVVEPIFEEGNLYAECFDYPTVPKDLYRTMVVSQENPILKRKKDFLTLFSPYERENGFPERSCLQNILF